MLPGCRGGPVLGVVDGGWLWSFCRLGLGLFVEGGGKELRCYFAGVGGYVDEFGDCCFVDELWGLRGSCDCFGGFGSCGLPYFIYFGFFVQV